MLLLLLLLLTSWAHYSCSQYGQVMLPLAQLLSDKTAATTTTRHTMSVTGFTWRTVASKHEWMTEKDECVETGQTSHILNCIIHIPWNTITALRPLSESYIGCAMYTHTHRNRQRHTYMHKDNKVRIVKMETIFQILPKITRIHSKLADINCRLRNGRQIDRSIVQFGLDFDLMLRDSFMLLVWWTFKASSLFLSFFLVTLSHFRSHIFSLLSISTILIRDCRSLTSAIVWQWTIAITNGQQQSSIDVVIQSE